MQPKSSSPWLIMSLNSWKGLLAAAAGRVRGVPGQAASGSGWQQAGLMASRRG